MTAARLQALRRHPVKGFTPERLDAVELAAGEPFPCDRLWAVENGPSGFDPAAPAHISKTRFAVLAQIPGVARARTRFDEAAGVLTVQAEGREPFIGRVGAPEGAAAFAAWLDAFLRTEEPDAVRGPLRVVSAAGHRFFDDPRGHVSLLNLDTVADFGRTEGVRLDPERFRCNLHVSGWAPWSELERPEGAVLRIGAVRLRVVKPIRRCVAIHVDPERGVRDLDLVGALRANYGHPFCGLYMQVEAGGRIAPGDAVEWEDAA